MSNIRFLCITIEGCRPSEEAAARCVESAIKFGYAVEIMPAFTPKDNPLGFFHHAGWNLEGFQNNPYSRLEPCVAAFLSHYECWRTCASDGVPTVILEHDAYQVAPLPTNLDGVEGAVNLGKPSFGAFRTPLPGIHALVSKPHFPGAHAYLVTPEGARKMLAAARHSACPTDVFLSLKRFHWLREAFPYPFECREEVSTIQLPRGCEAKHRKVKIVDANRKAEP